MPIALETITFDVMTEFDVRDMAVDCTDLLRSEETVDVTSDVASSDTAVLGVTAISPNLAAIDDNGVTSAIGKAIEFRLNGQGVLANVDIELKVEIIGTLGTQVKRTIIQPVRSYEFVSDGAVTYEIQRHGDFERVVALSANGRAIDNTDYNIQCKIRDRIKSDHESPKQFIPGDYVALTVTKDETILSQVSITLADTVTATLTATEGAVFDELPLLDFELENISTGDVIFTSPQAVQILETQAYDG